MEIDWKDLLEMKNYLTLRLNRLGIALLFLGIICGFKAYSQQIDKNYFKSPIKPGERAYLSGNFSELRPSHFHTGLDYKTGGVQGVPILAAADGWVHRIKINTYGYGNVIYLKHPNGMITLYGHLRNFNPKLEAYMMEKMYEAKVNDLELQPAPGALPVKRGERIGDSGNSGSSGGPHLHFEIRDSLDRAMDPLRFGFPEISDQIAPVPQSIAIVPLNIDSRVNGKFERLEVTPVAEGSHYKLPNTIKITGKVGIEVKSYDQLDGAPNRNGFPIFELIDDAGPILDLTITKVDFNLSRQFLLHTYRNTFSKLYFQKNLKFDYLHPKTDSTGHLALEPGVKNNYTLKLRDVFGNERKVRFTLEGQDQEIYVADGSAPSKAIVEYHDHILKIKAPVSDNGGLAKFFVGANAFEMLPAYQDERSRTYLWDMNFGIPERVDVCSEVVLTGLQAIIPAGRQTSYSDENVQIHFNKNTVFNDLFLRVSANRSPSVPKLEINSRDEYLWNSMEISWKVPNYTGNKSKSHAYSTYRNSKSFLGGTWQGDTLIFGTRGLGEISILEDTEKPTIKVIRTNSSELRFEIKDELSGIDSFEAYVNGKWVVMRYEYKQSLIWSQKLDNQPFKGQVLLKVTDKAGNTAEWNGTIN